MHGVVVCACVLFLQVLLGTSDFQVKANRKNTNLSTTMLAAFELSGSNMMFPGHPQLHVPIKGIKVRFVGEKNGGRTQRNNPSANMYLQRPPGPKLTQIPFVF